MGAGVLAVAVVVVGGGVGGGGGGQPSGGRLVRNAGEAAERHQMPSRCCLRLQCGHGNSASTTPSFLAPRPTTNPAAAAPYMVCPFAW